MERNVMGELNMYRGSGAKPNFSDIARRHGMDRHTVARYWSEGADPPDRRSERGSAFERVRDIAAEKAALPGMTKRAVYEFLLHMHNDPPLPGYGAFTAWCRRTGLAFGAAAPEAHPRFETPPGRQLQFDWKEDVRMVDANGEVLEFNVFTATLGYSRRHVFIPTPGMLMSIRLSPIPPTQSRRSRQRIPAVSADVRRRFRRPGPARGPSCDRTSR